MSALTRYFFSPVYAPRGPWSVISWWESRRLGYNVAVGTAGICSLVVHAAFALLPPHPHFPEMPLVGIVGYGVLANLCYSAGPLVDLWIRRRWGNAYAAVGPTLFRYGFVFSIGLTLLPVPLALFEWLLRVFGVIS